LIVFLFFFFIGGPFFWAVITSFKGSNQISSSTSLFWPNPFTLENYQQIIFKTHFLSWYLNSAIVSLLSTIISIIVGTLAAYALVRMRFPGRNLLSSSILTTYLIPSTILFIPFYILFVKVGLADSIWSLVISYPTFNIPFCTWILMGFFATVPKGIEDAARIDGCNHLQTFLLIDIPLVKPGIIAAVVFSFNLSWMEYIYALCFITTDSKKTVSVGISELVIGDVVFWGSLMAGTMLTALPVIILFIILQKYFVAGLTAGGVKG
jgi:multiple sugar transport system permease protein